MPASGPCTTIVRLETSPDDAKLRTAAEKVLADETSTEIMKRHARAMTAKTPGPR